MSCKQSHEYKSPACAHIWGNAHHAPTALRHMHDVVAVEKVTISGCLGVKRMITARVVAVGREKTFLHGNMRVVLLVGSYSDGIAAGPI
jgi:hypothetical protein